MLHTHFQEQLRGELFIFPMQIWTFTYRDSGSWNCLPVGEGHPQCLGGAPSLALLLTHWLLPPVLPLLNPHLEPHLAPSPPLSKPSVALHHPRRNLCTSALNLRPSTLSYPAHLGLPVPTPPLILSLPMPSCPLLASTNTTHPPGTP